MTKRGESDRKSLNISSEKIQHAFAITTIFESYAHLKRCNKFRNPFVTEVVVKAGAGEQIRENKQQHCACTATTPWTELVATCCGDIELSANNLTNMHFILTSFGTWALAVLCLLIGFKRLFVRPKSDKSPPGPWFRLPLLNQIPLMLGDQLGKLRRLRKK